MRELLRRIRRTIRWIPVLWRNQTWDYQYTLNILGHSLNELAECLEGSITESGPNDAKRIRYVCNLIDRLDNGVAWEMARNAKRVFELEKIYWNEIWDTIKKYGRGWWE